MKEIDKLIQKTELEISGTPSGELRNLLCDLNIALHLFNKNIPTKKEIRKQAKTYDNELTSVAEAMWMPEGFKAGAKWVCDKLKEKEVKN